MASNLFASRQRGAGILETMVGILIGLLVVLVVYNLLAVAEGYRRTTEGASDAQITGLMSQFLASRDAGNGGNGTALAAPDLIQCNPALSPTVPLPVPVLVTDGGSATVSDSFISTHSGSPHVLWSVDFTGNAPIGSNFVVQSPTGFTAPVPTAATPYWVVSMPGPGASFLPRSQTCELLQVSAASAPPGPQGQVTLTLLTPNANAYLPTAKLLNLGPLGIAGRVRYEVWNTTTASACGAVAGIEQWRCQLFTTELMGGGVRNPVAQNVVLMKVQYGIDTNNNDVVDCWTAADNLDTCGDTIDYSMANVRDNFTLAQISRILAVRIGVVIRSDEPDFKDANLVFGTRAPVVLFNCSANTAAACQSRVVVPNTVITDFWRFRTYETVVPLRNALFNATLP